MNYSGQGAAALAEMSPFGRPGAFHARDNDNSMKKPSDWQEPSCTMVGGVSGNKDSGWAPATYPLVGPSRVDIGFDPGSFIADNKIAVAIAAAVIAGGVAYYYGYR
jgi:hypothetical protein